MTELTKITVDFPTLNQNLDRIRNQIFRLLPVFEEDGEWLKPLDTLILELIGMYSFFPERKDLLALICKLEGLRDLGEEVDFLLYRRTIFEACGLVNKVKAQCQQPQV
jgi:hypothetical protein